MVGTLRSRHLPDAHRKSTAYHDLVPDIIAELRESPALARQAGIADERIIIDPASASAKMSSKTLRSWRLRDFRCLGYPLYRTSRKSMIGKTLNLPVDDRLEGALRLP